MLIVLSPAKTLDFDTPPTTRSHSLPDFIDQSAQLMETLRRLSPPEVGSLMRISDALAALNVGRYAAWTPKFAAKNAKQAVLAFNGDVYEGLDARSLGKPQLDYLQTHLRILSGLYGVLRPLDLMQPYRLEMGTKLANPGGKDLYAFWGDRVTDALNASLAGQREKTLVNLASDEYFKAVRPKRLQARIVTPVFEDWKGGRYKIISFHAKRARGSMARYAALHRIGDVERLKSFDLDGYAYHEQASDGDHWVFRRRLPD